LKKIAPKIWPLSASTDHTSVPNLLDGSGSGRVRSPGPSRAPIEEQSVTPSAFSTFSAISELFVTAGVLYVVLTNYRGAGFPWKVASAVIVFEFFVNMLYMTTRMRAQSVSGEHSALHLLAAIHGVLSLVIFALFVVLAFLAYSAAKRGENFFQQRPALTWSFIALWLVSVGSGEVFYLSRYF
jgi:hypothetical protein